ncbi:MAG: hypothetical protein AAF135_24170, partial [Bacteroidota bacterium]
AAVPGNIQQKRTFVNKLSEDGEFSLTYIKAYKDMTNGNLILGGSIEKKLKKLLLITGKAWQYDG